MLEENLVTVTGRRVFFLGGGEGRTILFLHGHRADTRKWRALIEALSHHGRVFAPEFPGYGRSQALRGRHTLNAYTDWLSKFVREAGLDSQRLTLVGASMGGQVALRFVLEYPALVGKLVLLWTPLSSASFDFSYLRRLKFFLALLIFFPPLRFVLGRFVHSKKLFLPWVRKTLTGSEGEEVALYEWQRWQSMSLKVWAENLWDILRSDIVSLFGQAGMKGVTCPVVLVLAAEDHYLSTAKQLELVKSHLPQASVRVLPGRVHVPKGELKKEFAESLLPLILS